MHPVLKITLKRSVLIVGGVIVGIPLILAAINAVDQDIKPEAIAFADFSDDEVQDRENGYFSWVGLAAPLDKEPHAVGVATINSINQGTTPDSLEIVADPSRLLGKSALKFKGEVSGLCGRDNRDCLARYRAKATEIRKWVVENQVLLERYRRLYTYPQFRETLQPRLRSPHFIEPARVASLVRAQHAMQALDGDPQAALRGLRNDTKYWRLVLRQGRSLIARMIAVASIHGNAQLISEIVATMPLDQHALALIAREIQPLSEPERNLGKIFRYEMGFSIDAFSNIPKYMDDPCSFDSWTDCLSIWLLPTTLFRPNATINQSYAHLVRMAESAGLPAQEWYSQIHAQREVRNRENRIFVWHIFYNPVGKVLNGIAEAPYEGYSGRVHNLDGFLRLVSIQIAAKQAGTRESAMDKYIADSAPALCNPYTGNVMEWDAGMRVIFFNGYNEKAEKEFLSKRIEVGI